MSHPQHSNRPEPMRPRGQRQASHPRMYRFSPTSSCNGKQRRGRHQAHKTARRLNQQRGDGMYAYACRHCASWHIGHDPERTK